MKRLPLVITLVFIVTLTAGYFVYTRYINKTPLTPWDIIPTETILAYEGSACEECLVKLNTSTIIKLVHKAIFTNQKDSLKAFTELIRSNFKRGSVISMHITKKDDFDFVFYLPNNPQLKQQFSDVLARITKEKGQGKPLIRDREYNGVTISEISLSERTFSWINIEGVWVGSFTSVLIEDVIRTYRLDGENFKNELGGVYQLPKIKNDGGNIYLNLKKVAEWLSLFASHKPDEFLRQFGKSALLDVKIGNKNNFVLNGFCLDSASNPDYILSSFSGQQPVPFTLKQFVSNRALMFASYGISDGTRFSRDLRQFSKHNKLLEDTLRKISTSLSVDVKKLTDNLSGELGVCWMESKGQTLSKILIINSPDSRDDWLNAFNAISQKLSIDTVFYEKFSNYEIRELPLYRFPEKIFWPLVVGFNQSYYTTVGDAMVMGENLEELKRFLEDIDREDTWGKSVAQNQFLESTLLESNVSLYINTPLAWSVLERSLKPRWKKFIQENQTLVKSLGMGAVQFSHLNDSYYTNISWSDKPGVSRRREELAASDKIITNFNESLANLFVVRSHINKSDEILVQDSARNLRLVSAEGKVLWKLPMDGLIVGGVEQVDYFNNGKLQYFFATPGHLHIIDRLGNYVSPFPVKIKERDIEFVSIVDYDHSKKYRFLITSKSGKLWMFDKAGVNLDGWTPNDVGDALFTPARHHRIRGKDYIVSIRKDGNVYLMNRRGELLKNFPLNLNARPLGEYFLEIGNDLESTFFVVVSRDGFRIKFTTDGKIQSRETLVKNTVDSRFSLVREKDSKSYLILRQEARQFTLIDDDLKQIVTSDFIGNNATDVQYLDFGAGKVYIAITDRSQDLSFVYNDKGKLLTALPIESQAVALRPLGLDKIRLFSISGDVLTVSPL